MRSPLCVFVLFLAVSPAGPAQAPRPGGGPGTAIPTDLDGKWSGELHHGHESTFVGFEFSRRPDGRVLVQLWCPNLNTYGAPIAWLGFADGKFALPGSPTPLASERGILSGTLFSPEVTFTARHAEQLPVDPGLPDVPAGPPAAWTFHAAGAIWTSPAIGDQTAYFGDSAGNFYAVDTIDGKAQWKFAAGTPLFGNAAVTSDAVYFAGDNGRLYKLDRATGTEIWRVEIGGSDFKRSLPTPTAAEWDTVASAPVVVDDAVIVGSADGTVRALDTASGRLRWKFQTGGKTRAAALPAGDRVYAGSFDHFVYSLDRRTGALVWRFDTGSTVSTPPVFVDGKIVIGTRDRSLLFALDARDGKPLWNVFYWFSWVESAPVLVDGRLYIGSSDSQRVRAIEPDGGKVVWTTPVGGWCWGTPLVTRDTVYYATAGTPKYFITERASLGALDRRTGRLKWRTQLPLLDTSYVSGIPGSLALAGGKILAASIDGTLTAYPVD